MCEYALPFAPQQVNMSGPHLGNILAALVSESPDPKALVAALVQVRFRSFGTPQKPD